ncbi:MAG: hypothetical protein ABW007_11330, partial [Chitinophagaceae bacterium]
SLDLFLLLFLHQGKKSKQRLRPFVEKKSALPAGKKVNGPSEPPRKNYNKKARRAPGPKTTLNIIFNVCLFCSLTLQNYLCHISHAAIP